jgi:hypothetical protein
MTTLLEQGANRMAGIAGQPARHVIFVSGLHHSGSTAAGMLLAQRSGGLVVGETQGVFSGHVTTAEKTHETCSCGSAMHACRFWGDFFERGWSSDVDKHLWLLERAGGMGFDTVIDTSKRADSLERWLLTPARVRVVYMVRAPRGWAASVRGACGRRGVRPGPLLWYAILWYAANAALRRRVVRLVPSIEVMDGDWVAIEGEPVAHHIAHGNRNKYGLAAALPCEAGSPASLR